MASTSKTTLREQALAAIAQQSKELTDSREAEAERMFLAGKAGLISALTNFAGENIEAFGAIRFERRDDLLRRYQIGKTNTVAWVEDLAFCRGHSQDYCWGLLVGLQVCDRREHLTWRAVESIADLGRVITETKRCADCDREQAASEEKYFTPPQTAAERLVEAIRDIVNEAWEERS